LLLFTAGGFDGWEAYRLLVARSSQGVGGTRPYGSWVCAIRARTVAIVGPATGGLDRPRPGE
jgi:hypothetical protein